VFIKTQVLLVLGVVLSVLALGAGSAKAGSLTSSEASILGAVNSVRAARGLAPLRSDGPLIQAARSHSARLMRADVFTHGSFAARIAASGARGPRFGENLAWGTGSRASARSIVRAWLASPGHRANLLRPGFRRIGIGARVGTFQGHGGATVVTADFAGR
jgi:uncharacterized protein YkwD